MQKPNLKQLIKLCRKYFLEIVESRLIFENSIAKHGRIIAEIEELEEIEQELEKENKK